MSQMSETALVHSMGQNGFKYLSTAGTTNYADKKMCSIQVISDATVTCISVIGDSLTSVSMQAGTVIVGEFSSVTCAGSGGEIIAYLSQR